MLPSLVVNISHLTPLQEEKISPDKEPWWLALFPFICFKVVCCDFTIFRGLSEKIIQITASTRGQTQTNLTDKRFAKLVCCALETSPMNFLCEWVGGRYVFCLHQKNTFVGFFIQPQV